MTDEPLTISVVVPTRNRPDEILSCVQSILANVELHELIVIDQSDGPETGDQLAGITDPRLRYERVESRGVCAARNRGTELSTGLVVACTDDDCRVPVDWIRSYANLFVAEPAVAVVCGRVTVPPALLADGFAIGFDPKQREWRNEYPSTSEWGITANMGVRRWVFEAVGGFDEFLGAGAPLASGGEPDFLYRVLRAGLLIVNASEVNVIHLGIRKLGPETKELWRRYSAGTSAAFIKHVRLGDSVAVWLYGRYLLSLMVGVGSNLVRRRHPTGAGALRAFLQGARASFHFRVDRATRMYIQR